MNAWMRYWRKERSNNGSGNVPKVELETASLEPKFSPAICPTTHLLSWKRVENKEGAGKTEAVLSSVREQSTRQPWGISQSLNGESLPLLDPDGRAVANWEPRLHDPPGFHVCILVPGPFHRCLGPAKVDKSPFLWQFVFWEKLGIIFHWQDAGGCLLLVCFPHSPEMRRVCPFLDCCVPNRKLMMF